MWASAPTAGTSPHLDVVGGDAYIAPRAIANFP